MKFLLTRVVLISFLLFAPTALAQTVLNLNAQTLLQKASLSLSPQTGSFQGGSTFDVGVFLDTGGVL